MRVHVEDELVARRARVGTPGTSAVVGTVNVPPVVEVVDDDVVTARSSTPPTVATRPSTPRG